MYTTVDRHYVKCLHCNGEYFILGDSDGCPHCGMKQPDLMFMGKKEIEISINPLTGEVTAF